MSKFDRVLSSEEITNIVFPCDWSENKDQQTACIIAREVEQATIAALKKQLAEQESVAWRVHPFDYGVGVEGAYAITQQEDQMQAWVNKGWEVTPLYAQPMPSSQGILDSSNQELPPLPEADVYGYRDSYSEVILLEYAKSAIDHHRTAKNHITDTSKTVDDADEALRKELDTVGLDISAYSSPKEAVAALIDWHVSVATDPRTNGGWQLVPVEPTLDMIKALRHRAVITHHGNIVNPSNMIKAALAAAPKLGGGDDC